MEGETLNTSVVSININDPKFRLRNDSEERIPFDQLIIAAENGQPSFADLTEKTSSVPLHSSSSKEQKHRRGSVRSIASMNNSFPIQDGLVIRKRVLVRQENVVSIRKKSSLLAKQTNESQRVLGKHTKQYTLVTERKARRPYARIKQIIANSIIEGTFNKFLHWTFRTSVSELLMLAFVIYTVQILIYTGLFRFGLSIEPTCISPVKPDSETKYFRLLFALAWSTFSTVGYGNVSPNLLAGEVNCSFISFLAFVCSFHGIIFVGFCSSIIFAKVLRAQNEAQVLFSDAMLIHYGTGLIANELCDSFTDTYDHSSMPFPILSFRIVNKHYDKIGSELIDATLKCQVATHNFEASTTFDDIKISLSDLQLTMPNQAFFKRVWVAKHIINEHSPLLTSIARNQIRDNKGKWPSYLNDPLSIRKSLNFDQIIVTLTGTLNVSANPVFAHKTYSFLDVSVGYDFVNVISTDHLYDTIVVRTDLINDVVEQFGGGGEELVFMDES